MSATTASNNTAIGSEALRDTTDGVENAAVGRQALAKVTGSGNIAIGYLAQTNEVNSYYNVSVGNRTLLNNTGGQNNVAIGHYAGYNETGSNKLYIDSTILTTGTSATSLIYGDFNTGKLYVRGNEVLTTQNGTLLSTTASISGNLQAQIDAIVEEGTTLTSTDGTINVTNVGLNYDLSVDDYISKTEVASISAGLDSRINSISTSTSTGVSGIHGTSLVELSQNNVVVNHSNISGDPIVSLTIPNSGSIVYVCGITEVTSSSFKVVLSDSVPSTGYKISWFRGGVSSTSTNSLTADTNFLLRTFSASESYTIPDGINKLICLGGSLTGITITMPANPTNGQILLISRFGLPSAFTLNANIGQTLQLGGSTSSGPGYYNRSYLYSSSTLTWYLIGE